ncbi:MULTISPECIES: Crp/Fnr family transcriptional regulator [unclassified Staphylococcus]|uniref:Crp/Fnr family transcriptional regulator n=1 Tax=unclassified Staphylococcus TaxID=91994 RepID=UPI0021D31335|nr:MULTISPECIES: Crp/Fnr family transcriptional regulator [unclassified Staphylococcus]UXR70381.1 Crp/Fnr family transcriptional regulator [Staphylococcus sp. IVB6246]UXR72447.1 Crp/Fnr family transcriptional regulator [Staphylococcus sp. IVB6240]UXR74750.1 Crp/Fnr family transcriptional regulator [Staphylococcus sp. IVB6238]UXR77084.1 Crp/Fnr family transcriptional regulator [Staphylococcus sp. IVB6233]UXR81209.1 Crp/Fnr family transcriptional regulator [Staphylococcus sp. IVB6218]
MSEHLCVSLVPLFHQLDKEDLERINERAKVSHFQKGDVIFQPGDEQLYIVAQGNMKIYQLSSNGKEQLLRVVEPGNYEGESQLFGVENEARFGEALGKTTICSISKKDFNEILVEHPHLSMKLLEFNMQKVAQLEQQTQFLSMEKIEERLVSYLLDLMTAEESDKVVIPMSMKDLATFLGTTPETLSRKLKYLEQLGYIDRKGRNISILDVSGLENI